MGIPVKPSVANADLTLISTWGGVQDRYTTAQRTDGYGAGTTLGRTFASTAKNWENCYWSEWLYRANLAVDYLAQNTELYTDSGAVNTFTLSIASGENPASYTDGLRVRFFANNTISGACTANINRLGAKSVKTFSGSSLSANQILAGQYVELVYDSDNNRFLTYNATSAINAEDVIYDNDDSGLTATDVQSAIDELSGVLTVPVGTVIDYAGSTAPTGFLKANGATVSRTTYANLFAVIGETYGSGDGALTFKLPDLRGEFIRGWDDGRGIDTGRTFGSYQADELKAHTHTINMETSGADNPLGGNYRICTDSAQQGVTGNPATYISANSQGGIETRPRNVALLKCIKY